MEDGARIRSAREQAGRPKDRIEVEILRALREEREAAGPEKPDG